MNSEGQLILGIESSCDDTSAAVMRDGKILANITAGQAVHEKYGGVVPELASRAHQKHIVPVVSEALRAGGVEGKDLSALAYTRGPGLLGSLLVGSSFAKSMAAALGIPAYPVHHMKAHVLAHFIKDERLTPPQFPFLCLTVSGGHTQIVHASSPDDLKVIGETLDDAAGEAFDKAAKLMGLPYPGGPLIDRAAAQGNSGAFAFPKPKVDDLNFSFSGLKTSFRNFVEKNMRRDPDFVKENLRDLCASLQYTIIDILMTALREASSRTGIKRIAAAGGVSANSGLRNALKDAVETEEWHIHLLPLEYCTDNGAMIAAAGMFSLQADAPYSSGDAAVARWQM